VIKQCATPKRKDDSTYVRVLGLLKCISRIDRRGIAFATLKTKMTSIDMTIRDKKVARLREQLITTKTMKQTMKDATLALFSALVFDVQGDRASKKCRTCRARGGAEMLRD
jgi:hypothetical protein